jgi:ABC-2 type transport system ATP-binding protein
VKAVIRERRERGTTIIFSSHILSNVQDIATRVGILHQGRIKRIGALDELRSRFGVGTELDVQLSRDSGRWTELASLAGVKQMEKIAPQRLRVQLASDADPDEAIHWLLLGLIDRGCWVRSLNPVVPSLDQVYLQYVSEEETP